jgi:hypothetical protein
MLTLPNQACRSSIVEVTPCHSGPPSHTPWFTDMGRIRKAGHQPKMLRNPYNPQITACETRPSRPGTGPGGAGLQTRTAGPDPTSHRPLGTAVIILVVMAVILDLHLPRCAGAEWLMTRGPGKERGCLRRRYSGGMVRRSLQVPPWHSWGLSAGGQHELKG